MQIEENLLVKQFLRAAKIQGERIADPELRNLVLENIENRGITVVTLA